MPVSRTVSPDPRIMMSFLRWWSSAQRFDPSSEFLEIRALGGSWQTRQLFATKLDEAIRFAEKESSIEGRTVSFSVVPRKDKCGSKECARDETYVLWFDIDIFKDRDDVELDELIHVGSFYVSKLVSALNTFADFRPGSSVAVLSGHGIHLYIALTEAIKCSKLSKIAEVVNSLAEIKGLDKQVLECARVMRLPGTLNWKLSRPFLVRTAAVEELV